MKRFALLILMICLAIDDANLVFIMSNAETYEMGSTDIHKALKILLKADVKKMKQPECQCDNSHSIFETEHGKYIFVKNNSKYESNAMFHGELESLKAICNTKTVLTPHPITTGQTQKKNNFLVLEFMNLTHPKIFSEEVASLLGSQLADMHLFNLKGKYATEKRFGFHVNTNCGSVPQNNDWVNDWLTFFIENRLAEQIRLLNTTNTTLNQNVINFFWNNLKPQISKLFDGTKIQPSLLHGNLWDQKNIAQLGSKPVILNPASFYGHHEYDIAGIVAANHMPQSFYDAYHKKIPKAEGAEKRFKLYALFHHLNHWNQAKGTGMKIIETVNQIVTKFDPKYLHQ